MLRAIGRRIALLFDKRLVSLGEMVLGVNKAGQPRYEDGMLGREPKRSGLLAWLVSLGVGLLPGPKGTWGSLLTAALAWLWLAIGGAPLSGYGYVLFVALLSGAVIWLSDLAEKRAVFGPQIDPGQVVIDETAGQLVALYAASIAIWWEFPLAFLLFRVFDILKPFPVNRLQNLPGGVGIVLDDLAAGLYALAVMALARVILL